MGHHIQQQCTAARPSGIRRQRTWPRRTRSRSHTAVLLQSTCLTRYIIAPHTLMSSSQPAEYLRIHPVGTRSLALIVHVSRLDSLTKILISKSKVVSSNISFKQLSQPIIESGYNIIGKFDASYSPHVKAQVTSHATFWVCDTEFDVDADVLWAPTASTPTSNDSSSNAFPTHMNLTAEQKKANKQKTEAKDVKRKQDQQEELKKIAQTHQQQSQRGQSANTRQ